ncbi:ABC transporter ATP-binding protein [Microlunatus soli]|uniref:Putative ABC transport system ATP-binding protein n=1 Tax=Microlunatus soli TaxID=630515 RepID=A0A1H1UEL3_9ACTN|nr:putative ABC transport system ATP-binding protein [Microlunatus soli]
MSAPAMTPTTTRVAARGQDVTKIYGSGDTAVTALDGVTVDFGTGTFTAIMGPSGSGKSTLMHCLAGLDTPTGGRITIGDIEMTGLRDRDLTTVRRDRIGFVFQSFNLLPTLTARQNVLLPLDLAGRRADAERFGTLVDSLGLSDRLDHRPSELSGGQQQRVAIARALITGPEVVFADEPTGALDSRTAATLLGYLQHSCRELGQTIVMVTHDPIAASYADRALLLSDGRITDAIADPDTDAVLAAMKRLEA